MAQGLAMFRKRVRLPPPAALALLYGALIALGAGLLRLPGATVEPIGWGAAVFTSASAVTVTDIVQTLEGPIALTACVDGAEDSCEVEHSCPMNGNWNQVNTAIRAALDAVTLADMLNPDAMFPLRTASRSASQTRSVAPASAK